MKTMPMVSEDAHTPLESMPEVDEDELPTINTTPPTTTSPPTSCSTPQSKCKPKVLPMPPPPTSKPTLPPPKEPWMARLQATWHPARKRTTLKYSLARLQAFQMYQTTANTAWVSLVVVMAPAPVSGLMILANFVPLAHPREGLHANYMYFIRSFVFNALAIWALRLQREYFLKSSTTSRWHHLLQSLATASVYVALFRVLPGVFGVFPVKFSALIGFAIVIPLNSMLFGLSIRHAIRPSHETKDMIRKLYHKFRRIVYFECSLLFIYSVFTIGFRQLHGKWQTAYACSLPVLRHSLRIVATHMARHLEDLAIETAVFSVEFFHSLYVAMCMGGANSYVTCVVLMLQDMLHLVHSLHSAVQESRQVINKQKKLQTKAVLDAKYVDDTVISDTMLKNGIAFAVNNVDVLQRATTIRVEASNDLVFKRSSHVEEVYNRWKRGTKRVTRVLLAAGQRRKKRTQVVPTGLERRVRVRLYTVRKQRPLTREDQKELDVLNELLALLATLERLVLREYVEAFVPWFYALYVTTTYFGPNRELFYGIREFTSHKQMAQTVCLMILFGAFEVISLLLLYFVVKKRFKFSVFTILAFVLETHYSNVQSKMLFYMIIVLNFNLIHYGEHNNKSKKTIPLTNTQSPLTIPLALIDGYDIGVDFSFRFDEQIKV